MRDKRFYKVYIGISGKGYNSCTAIFISINTTQSMKNQLTVRQSRRSLKIYNFGPLAHLWFLAGQSFNPLDHQYT
jgi:hypothetical protein